VILNDRLDSPPAAAGQLRTKGGAALPAGALVLWATGTRPATGLMRPALADALDAEGRIKARPWDGGFEGR
jgi:hypothetical protein